MQCRARKQDGKQCKARALAGHKRCALHAEPGRAAELGRKGGQRRAICAQDLLKDFAAPKNARDLADLIAQSLIEVREGKVNSKVANAISYLGNAYLQALEVAEIEVRLQALEGGLEGDENEPETQD
jgi:hypothetical protein